MSRYGRRNIRMAGYDYTQPSGYFVTICSFNKRHIFGEIHDGAMVPSPLGRHIEAVWRQLPQTISVLQLDLYVVMPNHFHAVLFILPRNYTPQPTAEQWVGGTAPASLGSVVQHFKSRVTRLWRETEGPTEVWQRNYYEHAIRDESDLMDIREYIANNPLQWSFDRENARRTGMNPFYKRFGGAWLG